MPPPGNVGHLPTHTKMWGTVLNGCFSDAGNNDGTCPTTACTSTNKADDSRLAFKVGLRWVASTGTNAAGWYLDEIEVVCQ